MNSSTKRLILFNKSRKGSSTKNDPRYWKEDMLVTPKKVGKVERTFSWDEVNVLL